MLPGRCGVVARFPSKERALMHLTCFIVACSLFAFVTAVPSFCCGAEAASAQPNIILCMTDDQGRGDVSYNGFTQIQTPNLDAMAANGLQLNRFYSAHPSCSPTRASVLTGRHPYRMKCDWPGQTLRKQEITIAHAVKQAGYRSAHFGKWHLNGVPGPGMVIPNRNSYLPINVGFDEAFSVSNYFEPGWTFGCNGVPEKTRGDGSEVIVAEAPTFIGASVKQKQPFLIGYGCLHVPHPPTKEDLEAASGSAFYGELVGVDRSMGGLRAGLRRFRVANNTLLIFCNDNGSWLDENAPAAHGSNGVLRGKKGELWEGGIRVPGIIEWPARIQKPAVSDVLACTSDIYPTVIDILGIAVPNQVLPLDGISLVPLIDGKMHQRLNPIGFWHHGETGLEDGPVVWNDNQYKFHQRAQNTYELYDLTSDISETTDLTKKQPDVLERMKAEMATWLESVKRSRNGLDYPEKKVIEPNKNG